MILSLTRKWYTAKSVIGELSIGGKFECFILERPDLNNQPKISCIPEGTYDISLYYSPHNKRWVPLLHDVPSRAEIEIHPANWPHQLEGCLAPGVVRDIDAVYSSDVAFDALFKQINDAMDNTEKVTIAITKGEQ